MILTIGSRTKYGVLPDRPAGKRAPGNTPGDHGHYATRTNKPSGHTKHALHPVGFSGRTIGRMVRRYKDKK